MSLQVRLKYSAKYKTPERTPEDFQHFKSDHEMQMKRVSQQQHMTWAVATGVVKDNVTPHHGRVSGKGLQLYVNDKAHGLLRAVLWTKRTPVL